MTELNRVRTMPLTETWITANVVSVSAEFSLGEGPDVVADIEVTYPFPARGFVRIHPDDLELVNDGKPITVVSENVKWVNPTVKW